MKNLSKKSIVLFAALLAVVILDVQCGTAVATLASITTLLAVVNYRQRQAIRRLTYEREEALDSAEIWQSECEKIQKRPRCTDSPNSRVWRRVLGAKVSA